ncbi:MAG: hypothetical protein RIK87_19505 [Fuerstiella sp.]
MSFDYDKVKNILVCPKCRCDLVYDGDLLVCINPETRFCYPIVDDIPRLLADEARQLSVEEWTEVMQRHGRDATTGQPV